jgi:hypothetical protein
MRRHRMGQRENSGTEGAEYVHCERCDMEKMCWEMLALGWCSLLACHNALYTNTPNETMSIAAPCNGTLSINLKCRSVSRVVDIMLLVDILQGPIDVASVTDG